MGASHGPRKRPTRVYVIHPMPDRRDSQCKKAGGCTSEADSLWIPCTVCSWHAPCSRRVRSPLDWSPALTMRWSAPMAQSPVTSNATSRCLMWVALQISVYKMVARLEYASDAGVCSRTQTKPLDATHISITWCNVNACNTGLAAFSMMVCNA